jgi:lipoprotein-releasing system permease protein
MRFEAFVASRYLRGKRKNRFVSLITLISIAGVSVGVMALIVVMSVMTGFDEALMATIVGNRAHIEIFDPMGDPMKDPDTVITAVEKICPEIVASSPFIEVRAALARPGADSQEMQVARIMGIDPEREIHVTQLGDNLTGLTSDGVGGRTAGGGDLPEKNDIVLGFLLADGLRVFLDGRVKVMTLNDSLTPLGKKAVKEVWLDISGISQAQMTDFDMGYGWVDLETAGRLVGRKGYVDGVHVRLDDPWDADKVSLRIRNELGYETLTWYQSERPFFEALAQEKVAMFIILMFIVLVAAFNITSTLIMVVMEKRRDIGILRTLGVSTPSVLLLFMMEGLYIGLTGTFLGVVAGTVLAYNLNPFAAFVGKLLGVDVFNSIIYYFDRIPVSVVPRDIALITLAAVILTFVSTFYPAWSASRVDPVDALRYE